jgi:hypothetical protein
MTGRRLTSVAIDGPMVATPVPEPAALSGLALGILLLRPRASLHPVAQPRQVAEHRADAVGQAPLGRR